VAFDYQDRHRQFQERRRPLGSKRPSFVVFEIAMIVRNRPIIRGGLIYVLLSALLPSFFAAVIVAEARGASRPHYGSAGGVSGIGHYYPGTWGIVEVQLANPFRESIELLSVLSFQGHGDAQFGRRVWVPANARRTTWYPVLPPATRPINRRSWDLQSFLFEEDSQRDMPIPAVSGEMHMDSFLPLGRPTSLTGLIADPQDEEELTNVLWAARLSRNIDKTVAILDWRRLPPTVESLDGLDQLMVASNQILTDTAACAAIRDWLHRGGRLWLYLNAVDPTTIGRLFGDALQISVVDRVQREQLQIYSHDLRGKQQSGAELRIEQPVELIRVIFSNARVSHSVDDWPIAAWIDVGRGTLLVTTLGGPGWHRDRTAQDQLPQSRDDQNQGVKYLATEPLRDVAFGFLAERNRSSLSTGELEQSASEQIGYSIVSRQRVAAVLGLFCLGIAVAGITLARMGSLEQIGWIGPLGVVLASAVLLSVGRASRGTVPKTVAVIQFAETSPDTSAIQVSGLAATYSADKSTDRLSAGNGGLFRPNLNDRGGTVLRMISTDRNKWELRNVVLPAGKQLIPFSQSYDSERTVRAIGTFGDDGLTGTISTGPFGQLSDAILAMPSTRHLAVQLAGSGNFAANAQAVLAPGEFLAGGLLTDEQRRRIRVYESLFDQRDDREPYPSEPTLLVWAKPLDLGFQLFEDVAQTGSTLVSIPLQLTAPPPESRVRIPGPFIRYRAVGTATSATFDERKRRWVGPFPMGLDTTLQFQLPNEVLPIRVDSARLTIGIKALSRELQITGFVDGKPLVLESRRSPLGRIDIRIDRKDVLQVNETGELTLGINVGDVHDDEGNRILDPGESQMWRIDDVQLEITGVTLTR
jgi:hypothetical protein